MQQDHYVGTMDKMQHSEQTDKLYKREIVPKHRYMGEMYPELGSFLASSVII